MIEIDKFKIAVKLRLICQRFINLVLSICLRYINLVHKVHNIVLRMVIIRGIGLSSFLKEIE